MKLLLVACLVASVVAAPPARDVQILQYENNNNGDGNYQFIFEQTDGTAHREKGTLKNEGREDEFTAVEGSFSWVDPDGVTHNANFIADDNGYQPRIEQRRRPGGVVPDQIVSSFRN